MMMLRAVHCRLKEFGLYGGRVRRELTNPFYSVSFFEGLIVQPVTNIFKVGEAAGWLFGLVTHDNFQQFK